MAASFVRHVDDVVTLQSKRRMKKRILCKENKVTISPTHASVTPRYVEGHDNLIDEDVCWWMHGRTTAGGSDVDWRLESLVACRENLDAAVDGQLMSCQQDWHPEFALYRRCG